MARNFIGHIQEFSTARFKRDFDRTPSDARLIQDRGGDGSSTSRSGLWIGAFLNQPAPLTGAPECTGKHGRTQPRCVCQHHLKSSGTGLAQASLGQCEYFTPCRKRYQTVAAPRQSAAFFRREASRALTRRRYKAMKFPGELFVPDVVTTSKVIEDELEDEDDLVAAPPRCAVSPCARTHRARVKRFAAQTGAGDKNISR
jgi:hypothetical protein